jgi:hypothetical protein
VVEKNLDHHQKEDQTHKVLQFPQRKDQQKDNQEKGLSITSHLGGGKPEEKQLLLFSLKYIIILVVEEKKK